MSLNDNVTVAGGINGYVGIGTTTPGTKLDVRGAGDTIFLNMQPSSGTTGYVLATFVNGGGTTYVGADNSSGGAFSAGNYASVFGSGSANPTSLLTSGLPRLTISSGGNVGIGMTNPLYNLDVAGSIHASGSITGGMVSATFQDLAEWVRSSGDVPPGTVVILNSEQNNEVVPSAGAYDTRVVGVVSARPGLLLGEEGASKAKIATSGRVKVRVDARKGAIHLGDLLVTSDTPGMAMKSEPLDLGGIKIHRPGTLLGKALEPLASGEGEVLVLLSLQ